MRLHANITERVAAGWAKEPAPLAHGDYTGEPTDADRADDAETVRLAEAYFAAPATDGPLGAYHEEVSATIVRYIAENGPLKPGDDIERVCEHQWRIEEARLTPEERAELDAERAATCDVLSDDEDGEL